MAHLPAVWSLILALVLVDASIAHAFTIRGTLTNGTTGATNLDATVVVVNPSGGMLQEREVAVRDGRFTISDLDPSAPIYLLRVDYAGVTYNTPVRFAETDPVDVAVTVYETTSSWEGIRVSVPHLAASRAGDHLKIEQVFDISNESRPPRTATGTDGSFQLFLPADMESLDASFVTSLGVPVERTPIPTDRPGVHRIDYPIRPGVTRVGVAYTLPYAAGSYRLEYPLLYDIDLMTVFAVDPEMKIESPSHTLDAEESAHGMTAYRIANLRRETDLVLAFAGGRGAAAAPNAPVVIVPGPSERFSLILMALVLVTLVVFIGVSLRGRVDPLVDPKRLRGHYNFLVARLARLDDLHAAEAVPPEGYRAAREELVGRLAALALILRAEDAGIPHETNRGASGAAKRSHP